jgi:hypothetical protein
MPSFVLNSPPVAARRRARQARIVRLASTLTTLADRQSIVNFCKLLVSTLSAWKKVSGTFCASRFYGPRDNVASGGYFPPPLVRKN